VDWQAPTKLYQLSVVVSAAREFQLWPASSDAEVPGQYLRLQNDMFAFGAWSMALTMSRMGQPAYLHRFTWADTGRRARLGACHGEELYFLSDTFPRDWTHMEGQERFGQTVRQYWTKFAKDGKPGDDGLPPGPAFATEYGRVLELGGRINAAPGSPLFLRISTLMHPLLMGGG
jgi:carboxylesterase type B